MTKRSWAPSACLLIFVLFSSCGWAFGQSVVRVGAFPNITHPQAMVGKSSGWFEKAMGPQVKIEWKSFNAGPSAIEALFAGAIDMTYIGPNPAISRLCAVQRGSAAHRGGRDQRRASHWWCATIPAFRSRKIFTARRLRRRRWAIRRTLRCARG